MQFSSEHKEIIMKIEPQNMESQDLMVNLWENWDINYVKKKDKEATVISNVQFSGNVIYKQKTVKLPNLVGSVSFAIIFLP